MEVSSFCPPLTIHHYPTKKSTTKKIQKASPPTILVTESFISDTPIKSKKKTQTPTNNPSHNDEIATINMNDYNIFHIDAFIKDRLIARISTLPDLEKKLTQLITLQSSCNTPDIQRQLLNIRKKIQDVQSTFELTYYILKSSDILEKYKKLLIAENSRSFVCLTSNNSKNTILLSDLLSRYINIARYYINIDNYNQKKPTSLSCSYCECEDIQQLVDDDSTFICVECGSEIKTLDDTPTFKDADRVNMANRYTYSRRGHFIEAMKKYQGKHNIDSEFLQIVVATLITEMNFHNLMPNSVTKDHIYMFLSEKKLSNHYDDINLLYHIITDKPCPEFSHLENELLDLFEQQEQSLDEVMATDKDNRINSINVYYKLYKLLQKLGYPCKKSDFFILKTKTKEDEHDEKMRKAWAILRWQWIETCG